MGFNDQSGIEPGMSTPKVGTTAPNFNPSHCKPGDAMSFPQSEGGGTGDKLNDNSALDIGKSKSTGP